MLSNLHLCCWNLLSCALTCRAWYPFSQRNLLCQVTICDPTYLEGLLHLLSHKPEFQESVQGIVVLLPSDEDRDIIRWRPIWQAFTSMLPHMLPNLRKLQICDRREEDCSLFLQELTLVSELVLSKIDFDSGERFFTLLSSFPNLRHLPFHDTNIWAESDPDEPSYLWRLQHYAKAISLDSLEISLYDMEISLYDMEGCSLIDYLLKLMPRSLPVKRINISCGAFQLTYLQSQGNRRSVQRLLCAAGPHLQNFHLSNMAFDKEHLAPQDAFLDLSRNSGLQSIAIIHSELFQEGVPMSLNGWIPEMLSTIRSPTVTSVTLTLTDVDFCTDDVYNDDNALSGGLSQILDRMGCGRVDRILSQPRFAELRSVCVLMKWTACRWYRDDNLELRYMPSATEGQSTPEWDSEELTGRVTHAIRSKMPGLYRKGILTFCPLDDYCSS